MKIQALLLSLIITTGAAMAQSGGSGGERGTVIHSTMPYAFSGTTTYAVGNANDLHVVTQEEIKENAEQQAKCIVELENRVVALEKKVSSLIKIVKMLQARVGKK